MEYLLLNLHPVFAVGVKNTLCDLLPGKVLNGNIEDKQFQHEILSSSKLKMIITDLDAMPGNADSYLKNIQSLRPDIPVFVFYSSLNLADIQISQSYGVRGYIHKSATRHELLMAVQRGLQGCTCFPELVADFIARKKYGKAVFPRVTQRQYEVLSMMAEGLENKRIARSLGISEHTIKIHVRSLLQTFGAANRTACVQAAQRVGILSAGI